MNVRNRVGICVTMLAVGSLWLTSSAQSGGPGTRRLLSDIAGPAMDRGLRANDAPRETNTARRAAAASGNDRFMGGSVIVKFRDGVSEAARAAILSRVNGTAARPLSYTDFDLVALGEPADPEAVARVLQAQPDVEYAQARYRVHPMFVPNDPLYAQQWNFPALDMERAWDLNPGSAASITVAVIDTGVAYRSALVRYNARAFTFDGGLFPALGLVDVPFAPAPDLASADRFLAPRDLIWDDTLPLDLDGHGTHVTGTIGQLTNNSVGGAGMAFNVKIMPIKVIDGAWDIIFDSPFEATDDVVARGVRYAADNGAKVLNMSIGRTGPPAPVVEAAVAYAVSKGAFVAVAGGNDFPNGNEVERLAEFAPKIDGMVAVAAIGRSLQRAFYSSTGPYIEVAAPGGDQQAAGVSGGILQQTYDFDLTDTFLDGPAHYTAPRFDAFAYQFFQGTSMATPHVSGLAALLMQQGITSPAAVEAAITRYATDLGAHGRDDEYGFGLINPRAALRGMGLVK